MAAWVIPALKAIIPHIGTIIGAAAPVFTRKTVEKETDPLVLVSKQIAELQSAAAKNASDTKELAAHLAGVVTTLEKAAAETDARLRRVIVLSGAAIGVSICAVGVAIATLVR
jgi:predicted KAP-like P-loop ATPase